MNREQLPVTGILFLFRGGPGLVYIPVIWPTLI